jgi:aminoglycoside phosphotransferase (APT) family kinase protein
MPTHLLIDEDLIRRLPLPLAQLYRRAHDAKTPLERHLSSFYLWEAALKLLGSVAIVEYAADSEHDLKLSERLTNLARPALGHWREFIRLLVPVLAGRGDEAFGKIHALLFGKTRDDMPRTAGLDATLREALKQGSGLRITVQLGELFDRLVTYRNEVLGHAAPGQLKDDFHDRMANNLLAAGAEALSRLDVLAGRRLLYIAEVRRHASGDWLFQRYELTGPSPRRIQALELTDPDIAQRLLPERVYLELSPAQAAADAAHAPTPVSTGHCSSMLHCLHPLMVYSADSEEALFLNARRGRQRIEYLCYTTGRVADRKDLGKEQREFLARVLGMTVEEAQVAQWAARSQAEEPPAQRAEEAVLKEIGGFELLTKLGRGGMGVVYRARQPSLGREVALKRLLHIGDPVADARFAREIRALARVEHPHLVKIFTSGVDHEQWFYAMELVEGATLSGVCDKLQESGSSADRLELQTWQETVNTVCEATRKAEKPLSDPKLEKQPGTHAPSVHEGTRKEHEKLPAVGRSYVRHVVDLIRQIAGAAHALHEAGVVHRDIKPGNIMVSADGSQAFLMDLGLAQLADDVEGRLTRTRKFVGTLRQPGASPGSGRRRQANGHLQPGSDALGVADPSANLQRHRANAGSGCHAANPVRRAGAAAKVSSECSQGSGSDCAEMFGEESGPALCDGLGTFGRFGKVSGE